MKNPMDRVPGDIVIRYAYHVWGTRGLVRLVRSIGAAWRCARIAARHRDREAARERSIAAYAACCRALARARGEGS